MHILYFHQHFSTPQGAAGTRSYAMAQKLLEAGHEVTMVCGSYDAGVTGILQPFKNRKRRGRVDGIDVIEFDMQYSNNDGFIRRSFVFFRFAMASVWIALFAKYDIAFATTTPLTAGVPGIFARLLRRKTFVFEVRDLWPELPRAMGVIKNPVILGLMSALEWMSYRSANRCVALSSGIAKGIEKRGVPADKIMLIPNGSDIDIFQSENLLPWRPDGVSSTDFMAVFTGTHGIANGLSALLNVAEVLQKRKVADIKLVLIGNGKQKQSLMQSAKTRGLTNIVFHPAVPKAELAGLMLEADLGIQCLANIPAFYYGTSPNKFFDYIAAGLPVIINYPGWLADMIERDNCGWVVPAENAEAFADEIVNIRSNDESLKVKGINALALAQRSFSREILATDWVDWVTGKSKT